jgi:hypothetical protein
MIIESLNAGTLKLTKDRLSQNDVAVPFYIMLRELKTTTKNSEYSGGRITDGFWAQLRNEDAPSGGEFIRVRMLPATRKIGCTKFDRKNFARIRKAIREAK